MPHEYEELAGIVKLCCIDAPWLHSCIVVDGAGPEDGEERLAGLIEFVNRLFSTIHVVVDGPTKSISEMGMTKPRKEGLNRNTQLT